MLHIATLHYDEPRWIDIQTRYLRQHVSVPFETWTALGQLASSHTKHFDHVVEQGGRHSDRLNHLALEISHVADESDLLMFLDGDAFPIADPMPLITAGLARAPLVAVRREENLGDRQPHPCFCVTTVGTWHTLPGDWSAGARWRDREGRPVSDVGGNLLRTLELTNTPWVEVLRTNRHNPDPLFFAIYGDVVYHHGAGFHPGLLPRFHRSLAPERPARSQVPVVSRIARQLAFRRRRAWARRTSAEHVRQSQLMYDKIARGGSEWLSELM